MVIFRKRWDPPGDSLTASPCSYSGKTSMFLGDSFHGTLISGWHYQVFELNLVTTQTQLVLVINCFYDGSILYNSLHKGELCNRQKVSELFWLPDGIVALCAYALRPRSIVFKY